MSAINTMDLAPMRELTIDEIDAVSGGDFLADLGGAIVGAAVAGGVRAGVTYGAVSLFGGPIGFLGTVGIGAFAGGVGAGAGFATIRLIEYLES